MSYASALSRHSWNSFTNSGVRRFSPDFMWITTQEPSFSTSILLYTLRLHWEGLSLVPRPFLSLEKKKRGKPDFSAFFFRERARKGLGTRLGGARLVPSSRKLLSDENMELEKVGTCVIIHMKCYPNVITPEFMAMLNEALDKVLA